MCVRGSKVLILAGANGVRLPAEHGAEIWYARPGLGLAEVVDELARDWDRVDVVIHPVGTDSRARGSKTQQAIDALAEIATHLSPLLDRAERATVVGVHYGAANGDWPAISNSSLESIYSGFAAAHGARPARVGLVEAAAEPQSARSAHQLARSLCRWTSVPVSQLAPRQAG